MWATLAAFGRSGRSRRHVWVDFNVSPSGRWMMSGFTALSMLVTGAPGRTKWLVAPASAIAISTAILMPLTSKRAFSELLVFSAVKIFAQFAALVAGPRLKVGNGGTTLGGESCGNMFPISCGLYVGIDGKPGGGRHVNPGGGRVKRPEFLSAEQFDVTTVTSSSSISVLWLGR